MYTMLKPLREVIAHTYTSVISINGDLLAHMYVEYSARVFKKYRSHNVSHTAQVYCIHIVVDVLAFRVKTVYTVYIVYIYIVCIDYIDYIFIYNKNETKGYPS